MIDNQQKGMQQKSTSQKDTSFEVHTDASYTGLEAALVQKIDGMERVNQLRVQVTRKGREELQRVGAGVFSDRVGLEPIPHASRVARQVLGAHGRGGGKAHHGRRSGEREQSDATMASRRAGVHVHHHEEGGLTRQQRGRT